MAKVARYYPAAYFVGWISPTWNLLRALGDWNTIISTKWHGYLLLVMFHSSQGESVLKQEIKILAVFGIRMLVKVQDSMIILVSVAKDKLETPDRLGF